MLQKTLFPRDLLSIFRVLLILALFALLAAVSLPAVGFGIRRATANSLLQVSHGLSAALFQYAMENNQYPDGASSTEIFQKLFPQYLANRDLVFVYMEGKTQATDGVPLKPENVGFDVTAGADANSSDSLPIVFTTGYKVSYAVGQRAVPVAKTPPVFRVEPRTWRQWWDEMGRSQTPDDAIGMAIGLKDMSSFWKQFVPPDGQYPNGSVPDIIPKNFNANGQPYHQLTPDGPLP